MNKRKRQERFARVVEDMIAFYIMMASIWSICHLVSDIFAKLGVA